MADRLPLTFLLLILCGVIASSGRLVAARPPSDIVSDGVHDGLVAPPQLLLRLNHPIRTSDSCDQTYGFMPCTTTALGNLFLIAVYGSLMFHAATCLTKGGDLLLEILGPSIVGGLLLPVLQALPEAMLVLVSGISESRETAQSKVSVGMGLLAGTAVFVLTITWGTCVVRGKCDLQDSTAVDGKDTKGFGLTDSGVSTDIWTSYAARIMVLSVVPFLVVQLPQAAMHSTWARRLVVLIALIVSLSLLISYCLYQVFRPKIQRRRLAYAKHKHVISGLLIHLKMCALGRLHTDDGEPNEAVIERLFNMIDGNGDGYISAAELRAFIVGIEFYYEINLDENEAADKMMKDFDTSNDSKIDSIEFSNGISRWLREAKLSRASSLQGSPNMLKYLNDFHKHTKREHDLLGYESDETTESVENPKWNSFKAVLLLLLGTLIAVAFADPLVDAVDNFSDATTIPTFLISFIVLPLATSSGEAASAIIFSSRKKKRSASLTFSELYAVVTVKNLLSLSVFLALVYIRGLKWDFSSEVAVIIIVSLVMGLLASFRTTFRLWASLLAFLLYPFSLALLYVLYNIFGLP